MDIIKLLAINFIAIGLVFTHIVSAEDFTFNVPVNITRLTEDTAKVRVACRVGADTNSYGPTTSEIINVPTDGVLNTTVEIRLDAPQGQNPANMQNYSCSLSLQRVGFSSYYDPLPWNLANIGTCASPNNKYKCASNAGNLTSPVSGNIP